MSELIVNGTLKRIDAPSAVNVAGETTYATGADLSIGVTIDEPSEGQRWALGAAIKDVTAVVYVMKADLAAAGGLDVKDNYRIVAAAEGEPDVVYQVVKRAAPTFGALSHLQLFCKVA